MDEMIEKPAPTIGVPVAVGLALATALLALAIGWALTRAPGEGSPEVTFARDMSAHHEQAVAMALILRERSDDAVLRAITNDIILTQQSQIGQMAGWLEAWGLPRSGSGPAMGGMAEMMGMASQADVNALETLPIAEAEVQFLQLMIRHHQGGVFMADDALIHAARPEVIRLAQSIVNAQQAEITLMRELLAQRGAQPLPDLQRMTH